ncbi:PqqD family protein [Haloarcula sp. S1CR25-12]|uniref:PqqD family protein n=1 Tax=Haloarcula saliterrae TaxID=2950534 RepID=A0ABU2FGS7_9EURY|nr:PqqD family protein [Haloarcula sp. S1CR25-12]MDS0261454.1 PqqD family protein [Haloarcula sp. S1CR25-12]
MILHVDAGEYYGFNEVASDVWDTIQEPQTVGAICDVVAEEYDVEYARCRSDIDELVTDLLEKDLAHIVDNE